MFTFIYSTLSCACTKYTYTCVAWSCNIKMHIVYILSANWDMIYAYHCCSCQRYTGINLTSQTTSSPPLFTNWRHRLGRNVCRTQHLEDNPFSWVFPQRVAEYASEPLGVHIMGTDNVITRLSPEKVTNSFALRTKKIQILQPDLSSPTDGLASKTNNGIYVNRYLFCDIWPRWLLARSPVDGSQCHKGLMGAYHGCLWSS